MLCSSMLLTTDRAKRIAAEKKALTTTPAKSSELSSRSPRDPPATTNTRKTVASAPQKARNGTPRQKAPAPSTMPIIAPSADPPEMPST